MIDIVIRIQSNAQPNLSAALKSYPNTTPTEQKLADGLYPKVEKLLLNFAKAKSVGPIKVMQLDGPIADEAIRRHFE